MQTSLILSVAVLAVVTIAQNPVPKVWPNQWYGLFSRNGTNNETGEKTPWEAHIKWYNWDLRSLRDDCMLEQIASTFVLIGKNIAAEGWLYNTVAQECIYTFVPVGPVKPDWMVDSVYIGRTEVLQTPVNAWVKEDHFYYESLSEPRLVQQRLPIDNKGFSVWEHFTHFFVEPVNATIFAIPSFCEGAPRMTLAEVRKHKRADLFTCFV